MPVRATSKAAFLDIQLSGIALSQKVRILNYIALHPGLTRREIFFGLNYSVDMGNICGRVNDLMESNLVHEKGCKHNPGTNQSANCLFAGPEPKVD